MNNEHYSPAVILSLIVVALFVAALPALHAQPQLTDAQLLALRAAPTNLIPASGTFWSVARPAFPPWPFDPFPELPAYRLPDNSWLVDDSTVIYPPPPPTDLPAAARTLLSQQSLAAEKGLASSMAKDEGIPEIPTNAPPETYYPPQLLPPPPPTNGTFYFLVNSNCPPYPFYPFTEQCDVYLLHDGSYLVDDSSINWTNYAGQGEDPPPTAEPKVYTNGLWLEITGVSNSLAHVILHCTVAGSPYTILSRQSWNPSDPWDAEMPLVGAEGQDWTPFEVQTFGRPVLLLWAHDGTAIPQRLWLQSLGIANGYHNLILHGTSEDTSYDVLSTTALTGTNNWANWGVETNVPGAPSQYWTPISVPLSGRPSLFLAARSYLDSNGSGIPDWWLLQYFGTTNIDPHSLCPSGDGWTILQAYQNGWNPLLWYTPPPPQNVTVGSIPPAPTSSFPGHPAAGQPPITPSTATAASSDRLVAALSPSRTHSLYHPMRLSGTGPTP